MWTWEEKEYKLRMLFCSAGLGEPRVTYGSEDSGDLSLRETQASGNREAQTTDLSSQAMLIPDEKAAVDKEWKEAHKKQNKESCRDFRLSHHLTSTCPSVTTPQQERAGALMLPSSCLDGSITPVGPGQNPQYTGAVQRREGCGLLTRTQDEPTKTTW